MNKKLKLLLQSCIVMDSTQLTDNPIGSKKGVATMKMFSSNTDISIASAAKNGKITKIGSVEKRYTVYLIFPVYTTIVTGE